MSTVSRSAFGATRSALPVERSSRTTQAGAICDQSVHQMGADEPGAAGYKSSVASHVVIEAETTTPTSLSGMAGASRNPSVVCLATTAGRLKCAAAPGSRTLTGGHGTDGILVVRCGGDAVTRLAFQDPPPPAPFDSGRPGGHALGP